MEGEKGVAAARTGLADEKDDGLNVPVDGMGRWRDRCFCETRGWG